MACDVLRYYNNGHDLKNKQKKIHEESIVVLKCFNTMQ